LLEIQEAEQAEGYYVPVPLIPVKIKTGNCEFLDINTTADDNVDHLMGQILAKMNVPPRFQCLFFKGERLIPGKQLADYQISAGSVLILIVGGLPGGVAKRPRTTSTERSKALRVAEAKLQAEEFTKRDVDDQTAINLMRRAKILLEEGPETPAGLCGNLTPEEIANIQRFIDNDDERNGPAFYAKLLPYFVPEYRAFKATFDQHFWAKNALEKSWNVRMINLFMNMDCAMTRDGILQALDERRTNIKKQQEEHARALQMNAAVQQQMNNVLENPASIVQLLADPRLQAALAAVRAAPLNAVD